MPNDGEVLAFVAVLIFSFALSLLLAHYKP